MSADITVKEAAALLRVTEETVRNKAKNGQWPHMRPTPRRVTFTAEQIDQIRTLNTFTPTSPAHGRNDAIRANLRFLATS